MDRTQGMQLQVKADYCTKTLELLEESNECKEELILHETGLREQWNLILSKFLCWNEFAENRMEGLVTRTVFINQIIWALEKETF